MKKITMILGIALLANSTVSAKLNNPPKQRLGRAGTQKTTQGKGTDYTRVRTNRNNSMADNNSQKASQLYTQVKKNKKPFGLHTHGGTTKQAQSNKYKK